MAATMDWMIYSANGYTGELIAREAKRRGLAPVLSGRNAAKIAALAGDLGFPSQIFSLDRPTEIAATLQGVGLWRPRWLGARPRLGRTGVAELSNEGIGWLYRIGDA